MTIKETASRASVHELRLGVAASLGAGKAVMLNAIDALAAGPRIGSPVELTLSELFAYDWSSLYQALRRGTDALGRKITSDDWLFKLRSARLAWLEIHPPPPWREDLGKWKIRILDATNHYRPQVKTLRVGYVHGTHGMKPGTGLSVLAERVGEGSWTLPLEIAWMPPECGPTSFGVEQIKAFVAAHGWLAEYALVVDSQYTVRPFLDPVMAVGVNVLGRVRNNRCFYLPVVEYSGFGRPAQLGAKFKLREPATHPPPDWTESWSFSNGRRVEARGWKDVRQQHEFGQN